MVFQAKRWNHRRKGPRQRPQDHLPPWSWARSAVSERWYGRHHRWTPYHRRRPRGRPPPPRPPVPPRKSRLPSYSWTSARSPGASHLPSPILPARRSTWRGYGPATWRSYRPRNRCRRSTWRLPGPGKRGKGTEGWSSPRRRRSRCRSHHPRRRCRLKSTRRTKRLWYVWFARTKLPVCTTASSRARGECYHSDSMLDAAVSHK